jgi:hypothetical protein
MSNLIGDDVCPVKVIKYGVRSNDISIMLVTACITMSDSRMTWPYSVDGTLQLLTTIVLGVLL